MSRERASTAPLGWSEPGRSTLELRTGSWRAERPVYIEATAPCRAACPAGEPIAAWIEALRRGDRAAAWALILDENPLPAVTGRVCAHPCEAACNRRALDGAVAINALERDVGDWGLAHGRIGPCRPASGARVAVVGSGPAGLACAWHLARLGHAVVVFEADRTPGGLLRTGIPEYRLPRAVLDAELARVRQAGVEIRTGRRLGLDLAWADLDRHDAVFLAPGAGVPVGLPVPGARARGVVDGLAFLRAVNAGERPALGARVVVVGGGSTAMDVARCARRLGAPSVLVVALEGRDALPADPAEVRQAVEEGVELHAGLGVRRVRERDGVATGLDVGPARLERAPDGSVTPVFEGDGIRALEATAIVLAIGQEPDLALRPPAVAASGRLLAAAPDGTTADGRVFAGGDATARERTVAHAIGAGARAARAIHARLGGAPVAPAPAPRTWARPRPDHTVGAAGIGLHAFERRARAERPERPAAARAATFVEVVGGLDAAAVAGEAGRCFTCGRCTACDRCWSVCPDMAIARSEAGYGVLGDYCKGCGLCARECPRGALAMAGEP